MTPEETIHLGVMRSIAKSLADTPLILKGGTALLFAYGLDRFSEDLDFDSNKPLRLENRIEKAVGPFVRIVSIDTPKNTETVQRYRVKYDAKGIPGSIKIEVSCRDTYAPSHVHLHEGIRVYDLSVLIDHKIDAFRNRTAARDLYDLHFILTKLSFSLSLKQAQTLAESTREIDAIDRRFAESFREDPLLRNIDAGSLALSVHEASSRIFSELSSDLKDSQKSALHPRIH